MHGISVKIDWGIINVRLTRYDTRINLDTSQSEMIYESVNREVNIKWI